MRFSYCKWRSEGGGGGGPPRAALWEGRQSGTKEKNFFGKLNYLNYLLITISMQLRHYLLNIL
jgi:hypothetical protein